MRHRGGRILIQAESSSSAPPNTVLVSGHLDVSGQDSGEKGGRIDVLGDQLALTTGATLKASGQSGGGTVHIGGDYQGSGDLQQAQKTLMQAGSLIDVGALSQGDGGKAIVWATDWTVFAGQILARGGALGGDGGLVETSGKSVLTATGSVDASSLWGRAGQWLLDPNNITIQTTGPDAFISGSPDFTTTNNSAILTVASIQSALNAGTSVTVTTASAGTNSQSGDITVANSIAKTGGSDASLSLVAHRAITVNAGVSISSTSGQMAVTLNADRDANGTGVILLNAGSSILSNGGAIVLGGGSTPLTTAARGYSGNAVGININNATLNASGGDISLTGQGFNGTTNNYGILLQAGAKLITTGSGTISLNGTGGTGTSGNRGIFLSGANTLLSSENGAITLNGQGNGTTTSNEGIYMDTGATLAASGTGAITLTGHASGTTVQGVYLNQTTAMDTIKSGGGAVALKSNQTIQLTRANITSPTSALFNIVLNSDLDANNSGRIALTTSNLLSYGGNITLGGGADPALSPAVGVSGAVEGISLNASTLNAAGGNISLRGTGYTVAATNNRGIYLQAAAKAITTGSGTLTLTGTGGAGTSSNRGIYLIGANTTLSSENGALTLTGQGSGTTTSNEGIYMDTGATLAATGTGDITLTGHAGGTTVQGIYLNQTTATDTIKSGGGTVALKSNQTIQLTRANITSPTSALFNIVLNSDLDANSSGRIALTTSNLMSYGGNITLGGGADPTLSSAVGVSGAVEGINLSASTLDAAGGNISLRGTGYTVAAASNHGVYLQAAAKAITSGNGTISLTGSSGTGTNTNYGVYLTGANTKVSAVDGDITLNGTSYGTGTSNVGVVIATAAQATALGNGNLQITGNSVGTGTTGNRGIYLTGASTTVSSANGALTLYGQGAGTTTTNEGLYLDTGAVLAATGTGDITLTGHASGTTAQGVYLSQTTAMDTIKSGGGTVALKSNQTVQLFRANITSPTSTLFNIVLNSDLDANNSGRIALTSSNLMSFGGTITLGGGANPALSPAVGVSGAPEGININVSTLDAAGGNISLRGTGYTAATASNYGIYMQAAAKLLTTGSGTISLSGMSGVGTTTNYGIYLTGANTKIGSLHGDITLNGTGRGNGTSNAGIALGSAAQIAADGNGSILATGLSTSTGTTGNRGIYLTGTNTSVTSANGDIVFNGQGGGTTTTNEGISLDLAATLAATGTGAITLTGHASGTTVQGVYLNQTTAADTIKSGGGAVTLKSNQTVQLTRANITSPTSTPFNIVLNSDLDANSSGRIALTTSNLLSFGGNITLGGGADPALSPAVGVSGSMEGINLNASTLNAAGGNISLRGTGYAGTTNNYGIYLQAAAKAQTSGTGTVSLIGTGGAGTSGNRGIYLTGSGTSVSAVNGAITLTGTGAGTGSGYGIEVSALSTVTSTGSSPITINGIAGTGAVGYYNPGSSATIGGASATGPITLNLDSATWGLLALRSTGSITFAPRTASTQITTAGTPGLGLTSTLFTNTIAGSLIIGRTDGSGGVTMNTQSWTAPVTILSGDGTIAINGAQTMGANSFTARTTGLGDINLGISGAITSSASGDAITLASAHNFINASGVIPLTASSGRWLIYSTNPAADTLGTITANFRRFSCTYGGSCPSTPVSGNGLLYSMTPLLTITPTALAPLTYGDAAPALTGYGYSVSGYLGSDNLDDSLTGSLTGSTTYSAGSTVGTYNIDYASGSLASALGYGFTYANNASAFTVGKRTLTATVQNKTITYGTTTPTLDKSSSSDVVWGNLYGSDTGAGLDSVAFSYGGATAGSANSAGTYTLDVSAFSDNNYTLGSTTTGLLTINPYTLRVNAHAVSKIFGSADPALTYSYGTLQNGDTASLFSGTLVRSAGETVGTYAILQGSLALSSNYILDFVPGIFSINAIIPASVSLTTQTSLTHLPHPTPADISPTLQDPMIAIEAESLFSGTQEASIQPSAAGQSEIQIRDTSANSDESNADTSSCDDSTTAVGKTQNNNNRCSSH